MQFSRRFLKFSRGSGTPPRHIFSIRVSTCETSVLLCQCVQLLLHPVNQLYMHTLFCFHLKGPFGVFLPHHVKQVKGNQASSQNSQLSHSVLLSCLAEQSCRAGQGNHCHADMETAEPSLQAFTNRAQRPHSLWVAGKRPIASLNPEHSDIEVCPGHFNTLGHKQALIPGTALTVTAAPGLTAMAPHQNAAKGGHRLMLYFPLPLHLPWQAEDSQGEQQRTTHFLTGKRCT